MRSNINQSQVHSVDDPIKWEMSYRRVFLADVATASAALATPLRQRNASVHRVRVQGLCVWCERLGEQQLRVEIDDGTDVALLQVRGEAVSVDLRDVAPGRMVKALAELRETPVFASGRSWRRWLDATSLCVVDDPNAESLHVLETLHLQKTVYLQESCIQASLTHAAAPASLPLLPFPDGAVPSASLVGVKRKADTPATPSRSRFQPVIMERTQLMSSSHNGIVPPAEYQFHVTSSDLKLIESGIKTLEIRLNNPPYSIIRANDRIKFNGKSLATVKAVRKYAQLRSALELESLSSLTPPASQDDLSTNGRASIDGALRQLRQFISASEESHHGVAVFEFAVNTAAATAQHTPEEWSKLIYEHVSKAGSAGCTVRDLQFAFPALAVDKIEAMLADLQMDAIVYQIKGTYRLV